MDIMEILWYFIMLMSIFKLLYSIKKNNVINNILSDVKTEKAMLKSKKKDILLRPSSTIKDVWIFEFELQSGEIIKFFVDERMYERIQVNSIGRLVYKGTNFYSFEESEDKTLEKQEYQNTVIWKGRNAYWKLFTSRDWLLFPVILILGVIWYGALYMLKQGNADNIVPGFIMGIFLGVVLIYLFIGRYVMKLLWKRKFEYQMTEDAIVISHQASNEKIVILYKDIFRITMKKGIRGTGSIYFNKTGARNVLSNMGFDYFFAKSHPDAFLDIYQVDEVYKMIVEKIENENRGMDHDALMNTEVQKEKHSGICLAMDILLSLIGIFIMVAGIGGAFLMTVMTRFKFVALAPIAIGIYGYFMSFGRLLHVHRKKTYRIMPLEDETELVYMEKPHHKSIVLKDKKANIKKTEDVILRYLGMDWFVPGM